MSHADNIAVLIAGPTASGKSALALQIAREHGGVVINADSMQVYHDLCIITARPTPDEEASAPHKLYGHVDAATNYSVGQWCRDASEVLADVRAAGKLPIFVGGTGLYFHALTNGISNVPPTPPETRERIRARIAAEGAPALHAELADRDPSTAARLMPNDRSRIGRALEVIEATGRSLSDWHREGMRPIIDPARAVKVFLQVERKELVARIEARFDAMLDAGALDEVRALAACNLDPLLPAMKAHGVPALIRQLRGEITLAEAADTGKMDTRRYAKRQVTWFRNQMPGWTWSAPTEAAAAISNEMAALGRRRALE